MKRGIIIKGLKRGLDVGAILRYANSLLKVKTHLEKKDRDRSDLCLFFEKDGDDLYSVAYKLRAYTKAQVDVKYVNVPQERKPVKKTKKVDRKEMGNPYLKPAQKSFIDGSQNNVAIDAPKLRIDLNLKDVDELFEFLRSHPVNTQTKERYKELLPDKTLSDSHDDLSHRTTFVADNIKIDKCNVEVFVNGELSTDVGCQVEEKADAYILHLFYKGERKYSKAIAIRKDEAQKPIIRFRDHEDSEQLPEDGKRLSITFKGYDAYLRHVREHSSEEKEKDPPSTKYIGQPHSERKTAIVKQTEVSVSDEETRVMITEPSPIQNETESQIELEELKHADTEHEYVAAKHDKKTNWFIALLHRILDWLH